MFETVTLNHQFDPR